MKENHPKSKNIPRKYTFSKDEREKLQNIQIGIINAEATLDGLNIYKNMLLESVYKRLGIAGEPNKGYSKSIRYNIRENIIEYLEEPIKEEKKDVKK
jgi:hypothetical protein